MNWVGVNILKTIDVDNLIFDFDVKRKLYKINKIEFNITASIHFPFELIGNRKILFSNYNKKYGLGLESNIILSKKSYAELGMQIEKKTNTNIISNIETNAPSLLMITIH